MLLTLSLVVLIASIITLFSQEFITIFKKIMAIKGAPIFLPLIVASGLVLIFDYWVLLAVYYYRAFLTLLINGLIWLMPFGNYSYYIAAILVLTFISLVPVFLFNWYWTKKTYKPYPFASLTIAFIWIFSVFSITVYELQQSLLSVS